MAAALNCSIPGKLESILGKEKADKIKKLVLFE